MINLVYPKHWWQIYFTLLSKEKKKAMQSGFKIQLLFYQTKYFTTNLSSLIPCKFHKWITLLFPDRSQSRKNTQKTPGFPPQEQRVNLIRRLAEGLPNFSNPLFMLRLLQSRERMLITIGQRIQQAIHFTNKSIMLYNHALEAWAPPALPTGLRSSSQEDWNELLKLLGARKDLQFKYKPYYFCLLKKKKAMFSMLHKSNFSS